MLKRNDDAIEEALGRDVILRYNKAQTNLVLARAEIAVLEVRLIRMIPKLCRELGSNEAVRSWLAENFPSSCANRIKRSIR